MTNLKRYLLFMVVLTISCTHEKKESQKTANDLDEFTSYAIDLNAPQVKFQDMIESLSIFRLEETEETLLGNIYNIAIHNDMFVFPENSDQSIYFFSDKGDFIRKLNMRGDGPEEYSSLWSYWFKADTLKVYDNQKQRLIYYSLEGDYLNEIKVPQQANHVYENERGYWLDMSMRFRGDSTNYELISYDHNMENPIRFLPFNQLKGFPITTTINSMVPYKDGLLYKQILNDSVYFIRGSKLESLVHLDFGSEFLWSNEEMLNNPQGGMQAIDEANKVWVIWPKIGEELIYLTYNTSFQDSYQMFVHRVTGEQTKIDTRKNAEEKFGLMFNQWEGDKMLVGISSVDLADLLSDLEESQYSFQEGSSLEIIESSENPALMWVKFKDQF